MGKRGQLEDTAIRLYAEGMEIPAISSEIGVSENSLRDWKKRAGTEWDEARSACRKGVIASMETVGARIIRARQISDQLTGDTKEQGKMGLGLNSALQTIIYDLMDQMQTTELGFDERSAAIEQTNKLAGTLLKLEQSANLNLKREAEIRKAALEAAEKKAVEAVDAATQGSGKLTPEEFKRILRETYGA